MSDAPARLTPLLMAFLAALDHSAFSTWLRGSDSIWAFPTVLTLHTLGMMVLAGASAALDLRLLGVARQIPLPALRGLFPLMWGGFWLNLVSGSMLFVSDATTKGTLPMFYAKLLFVAIGVVTLVLIRREVYGRKNADPFHVSSAARFLAIASIAAWTLAITAGRLLAYVA